MADRRFSEAPAGEDVKIEKKNKFPCKYPIYTTHTKFGPIRPINKDFGKEVEGKEVKIGKNIFDLISILYIPHIPSLVQIGS